MQNPIVITMEDHRQFWIPFTTDGLETLQAQYEDGEIRIAHRSIESTGTAATNEKKWILVRYETEKLLFYPFSDQTLTILFEEQDIILDFYVIEVHPDTGVIDQKAVFVESDTFKGTHTLFPYSAETIGKIVENFDGIWNIQIVDRGLERRYNFTLEITLNFSFDGTEKAAKEKIDEDRKQLEKIITEGMTGSGLEYGVVSHHIYQHQELGDDQC